MMEEVDLSDNSVVKKQNCLDAQISVDYGPPDPQIQIELERLNTCTDLINKLEVDLDEGRMMFRQMLSESTHTIDSLSKKLGKCIEQARPYYDARIRAKQSMNECQKSAVRFERAVSQHTAAREMVQLAEEGLLTRGCIFDSTWQEMLNHATTKVNDAEREKIESTNEHREKSAKYHDADLQVKVLQKELKRAISKSRPYFEMKSAINQRLEEQKRHIKELEEAVTLAKSGYAQALINLETISDHIHKERENKSMIGIRGVGVGAESSTGTGLDNEASKPVIYSPICESEQEKSRYKENNSRANWQQESNKEKGDVKSITKRTSEWQFVPPLPELSSGTFLAVDDRESIISDTESLTSIEMLSEEAISNLMLENELQEVSESLECLPDRSPSSKPFVTSDPINKQSVDTICVSISNESSQCLSQSDTKSDVPDDSNSSCPNSSSSQLMPQQTELPLSKEDMTTIKSIIDFNPEEQPVRPKCLHLTSPNCNNSNLDFATCGKTVVDENQTLQEIGHSSSSSSLPSNCSELSSADDNFLGYIPLEHSVEDETT